MKRCASKDVITGQNDYPSKLVKDIAEIAFVHTPSCKEAQSRTCPCKQTSDWWVMKHCETSVFQTLFPNYWRNCTRKLTGCVFFSVYSRLMQRQNNDSAHIRFFFSFPACHQWPENSVWSELRTCWHLLWYQRPFFQGEWRRWGGFEKVSFSLWNETLVPWLCEESSCPELWQGGRQPRTCPCSSLSEWRCWWTCCSSR